jgi:hypothetical protein
MLRFLTPTEAWRERVTSKVSLPDEWPVMLVEIFHTEDGQISMTCVLGVPKSSLKAFLAQGAYLYEFQELPKVIVLDAHFAQVEKDLATKMDSRRRPSRRNSPWLRNDPPLKLHRCNRPLPIDSRSRT